jgi:hypothetical protein
MTNTISPTNQPGYFQVYIDQVKEKQLTTAFIQQSKEIKLLLPAISEQKSMHCYAAGKWTIKEILQHLIDSERIFTYRAVCIARNETSILPGFDENQYAAASNANNRTWESLSAEFVALRKSTLFLFDSFSAAMLDSKGKAGNNTLSVAELGFILIGHFSHHKRIMEERYL